VTNGKKEKEPSTTVPTSREAIPEKLTVAQLIKE
jgi:hypothetical protein